VVVGYAGIGTGAAADTRKTLAPTGNLRVAFLSTGPIYARKDATTGELKGVAPDLGQELARRVGVPYVPVGYTNVPAMIAGAKSDEWDVALMGINAERATAVDFSPPFMEVEQGFLVRAGAPISDAPDVDKVGIRIGVLEKAGPDVHLSGTVKHADLVRAKDLAELFALIGSGKADVVAATKTALFAEAEKHPGSRVLEGRILAEPIGIAVPKGRDPSAAAFVGKFVEEVKARGLVKSAIGRAGLRGVVVAP
jgi:polar amino acid transport system substrate-binding protein